MAATNLTRRGFLGHSVGAYTAVAMGAGAVAFAYDPMVSLIHELQRQDAIFNASADGLNDAEMEAFAESTYRPLYIRLRDDAPAVTTAKGAVEAIRLALTEVERGTMPYSTLSSALAFLENGHERGG